MTVLALVCTASSDAVRADDLPDSVRITVERVALLAEAFADGPVARHLERATNGFTEEEIAPIVGTWHERRPCKVPAERAANGPVEVGGWLGADELDGASVGELLEDGWGRPIEVWFELRELSQPLLVLRSAGANGRFEGPAYRVDADGSTAGSDDLVWDFDGFCWAPAIGIGEEERPPRRAPDAEAQLRTMRDVRDLGVGVLSWVVNTLADDQELWSTPAEPARAVANLCPPSTSSGATESTAEVRPAAGGDSPDARVAMQPPEDLVEAGELARLLHPAPNLQYLVEIPVQDGWGHLLEVYLHRQDLSSMRVATVRSPGRDGRFEGDCYTVGPFDPEDVDRDIVWADGFFVRWPGSVPSP